MMRDEELRKALVRTLEVLSETLRLLEEVVDPGIVIVGDGGARHERLRHHADVVNRLVKDLSE